MKEIIKKIVFIDMDGVLVNFGKAIDDMYETYPKYRSKYADHPDLIPGIFKNPKPIDGAIKAVEELADSGRYELFIATTSPWGHPEAAMHKRLWVQDHFKDLFKKKMFLTHRKDLLLGDYLIDDREANGAADFKGELLSFGWAYEKNNDKGGWNEYRTWKDILNKLL